MDLVLMILAPLIMKHAAASRQPRTVNADVAVMAEARNTRGTTGILQDSLGRATGGQKQQRGQEFHTVGGLPDMSSAATTTTAKERSTKSGLFIARIRRMAYPLLLDCFVHRFHYN